MDHLTFRASGTSYCSQLCSSQSYEDRITDERNVSHSRLCDTCLNSCTNTKRCLCIGKCKLGKYSLQRERKHASVLLRNGTLMSAQHKHNTLMSVRNKHNPPKSAQHNHNTLMSAQHKHNTPMPAEHKYNTSVWPTTASVQYTDCSTALYYTVMSPRHKHNRPMSAEQKHTTLMSTQYKHSTPMSIQNKHDTLMSAQHKHNTLMSAHHKHNALIFIISCKQKQQHDF